MRTIEAYGENLKGVHTMIPRLLHMFTKYGIKATFSTVGFLFYDNKAEVLNHLPTKFPNYTNKLLSPYESTVNSINDISDEEPDYYFAPNLIKLIQQYPEQEIGTHTFSHYYCLEDGQTISEFRADIESAQKIATRYGITLTSLIFPRNQFNNAYLQVCQELGIICYRGNEDSWLYAPRENKNERLLTRMIRLADAYVNLTGHNCYSDDYIKNDKPMNIPSSRFLREYKKKLNFLDSLKLKRITSGMTYAAQNNLTYHLWWHPHNFGINQEENFDFLEKILRHYHFLQRKFNFQSYTMSGLARHLDGK